MFAKSVFAFALILSLAACDSAEERAEEHYQEALALAEAGDYDRAIVELRNVFQLDGGHREARYALAKIFMEEKKNYNGARQQFLRIVEQYPAEIEARVTLAELSFQAGNFEQFDRHSTEAETRAPEDPRVQALAIARRYRDAAMAEDAPTQRGEAEAAGTLLETIPDSLILRSVVLDNHLRENELREALAQLDWLVEAYPETRQYWNQRLAVLTRMEDFDTLEAQLKEMVARFDDPEVKATLIRFYLWRDDPDKAEAFLRELAAASDGIGPRTDLIRFLMQVRGEAAAREELQAAIAEKPDNLKLKTLAASIDYEAGRREEAIQALEASLEDAESSDATNTVRVVLARMLLGTGNEVGARAQVEQVLADDQDNPQALKLQAAWLIEADDTDAAIAGLRTALEGAPEDAEAMTLMAQAYTRAGRTELARDFLALAVEASNNAPTESVRYARLLIEEERYLPAEDILLPALQLAPENLDLLATLGRLYLAMNDLARVEQVVAAFREIGTPPAERAALALETERINRQNGPEEALAFLENLATNAEADLNAKLALVRARLNTGDAESALTLTREMLADDPEDDGLRAIAASVEAANGNFDTAADIYRDLLDEDSARPEIWIQLSRVARFQGDEAQSLEFIEDGIAANPENADLLWAKASVLEQQSDIDAAIDIYNTLYERDSSSLVIANNLASLLSTHRSDDADSLERAWIIARRLRDVEIPAIQDTYGWIIHLRGESEEALPYLEAAAAGLPQDPIVRFHLAEVYAALDRPDDALEAYLATLSIAGPLDKRSQIEAARAQIKTLQAAAEEPATDQ